MSDKPTVETATLPTCFVTPLEIGANHIGSSFGTHNGIGRVVYSPALKTIQIESVHGRQEFSLAAALALQLSLNAVLIFAEELIEGEKTVGEFQTGADSLPDQVTPDV